MLVSPLHRSFWVLAILSVPGSSSLSAQWFLGFEVGGSRFWGGSTDTGGENTSFVPYRPTTFGVGLERQSGKYAFGVKAHYAESSLALVGAELLFATEGVFNTLSVSPEAVARLATLGPANQLRIHAGPLFEVWDLVDLESRTRVGAQASISLDVPLGGRFRGAVVAGAAVIPSPYNEGELDAGGGAPTYDLQALWRRSFGVSLHYRL
jgi:hypothetical protein